MALHEVGVVPGPDAERDPPAGMETELRLARAPDATAAHDSPALVACIDQPDPRRRDEHVVDRGLDARDATVVEHDRDGSQLAVEQVVEPALTDDPAGQRGPHTIAAPLLLAGPASIETDSRVSQSRIDLQWRGQREVGHQAGIGNAPAHLSRSKRPKMRDRPDRPP